MRTSKHFEVRKNDRDISDFMLQLTHELGDSMGDKIILGKKKVIQILNDLQCLDGSSKWWPTKAVSPL